MAVDTISKASPPAAAATKTVRSSSPLPRVLVVVHCFLAAYAAGVLWVTANTWRLATIANTSEAPAPILADQIQFARTIAMALLLVTAALGTFLGAKKGGMRLAMFFAFLLAAGVPVVMAESAG